MDEKKQIEEMARDMCGSEMDCKTCMNINGDIYRHEPKDCSCRKYAERLIEKKYVKLLEDEMVLTREEQENHIIMTKTNYESIMKQLNQARKETAREILQKIVNIYNDCDDEDETSIEELIEVLRSLAQQYDVELKNEDFYIKLPTNVCMAYADVLRKTREKFEECLNSENNKFLDGE